MFRRLKYSLLPVLAVLALAHAGVAAVPMVMEEKDVLPYLEKMISWQRAGTALEVSPELPRQLILKNDFLQHSRKALEDSFGLARALAETLPPAPPTQAALQEKVEDVSKENNLRRAIELSARQVEQLQKAAAHGGRSHLGELRLAQEHLNLLQSIAETVGEPVGKDESLLKAINRMQASITNEDTQKAPEAAPTAVQASSASGILGLATRIYAFAQAKSAVKALLNDTKAIYQENRDRTQIIRDAVKGIMDEGSSLNKKAPAAKDAPKDKDAASAPKPTYDELLGEMKQLSKVAIALSQSNKSLTICIHDLNNWIDVIMLHIKDILSNLVFRLFMLLLAIGIAYGLSVIARKATRRYVSDRRRRDQLRMVRKVTLGITIAIILFLGFFTDLSSLATFAGLLTAGVAFATKDMILSLIAYIQFFGSSDIRIGDDVTIAGVTGKITHIGMLRFYMMETVKSDVGFLPTGRIVGFANSVLFQPTPLFRQTPGTNFVWNEIDITLQPSVDHTVAYKKLNDIVQKVYAQQQEVIRRNEVALQKVSPFKLEFSVPQTYFKFTNMGVVFAIRYAVERDQAQAFHFQMTTQLLAAIRKDPELKVQHITGSTTEQAPATA